MPHSQLIEMAAKLAALTRGMRSYSKKSTPYVSRRVSEPYANRLAPKRIYASRMPIGSHKRRIDNCQQPFLRTKKRTMPPKGCPLNTKKAPNTYSFEAFANNRYLKLSMPTRIQHAMTARIAKSSVKLTKILRIQHSMLNTACRIDAFTFHHQMIHKNTHLMTCKPMIISSRADSSNAVNMRSAVTQ